MSTARAFLLPAFVLPFLFPSGDAAAWDTTKSLCFSRTYDAEHLKKNPKQKVTWLALDLQPETDLGPRSGWRGGIFLRTRDARYTFVEDVFCSRPKRGQDSVELSCRYAFDGGPTFQLVRKGDGVEMRLPKASYVVDDQEMDLEEREAKGAKIDSDLYRLTASPCRKRPADQ